MSLVVETYWNLSSFLETFIHVFSVFCKYRWMYWEHLELRLSAHQPVLASTPQSLTLVWLGALKMRSQTLTSWTSTATRATLWLTMTPRRRRSWSSAMVWRPCSRAPIPKYPHLISDWRCVIREGGHAGGRSRHRWDHHRHRPQTQGEMPQHQSKPSNCGKYLN